MTRCACISGVFGRPCPNDALPGADLCVPCRDGHPTARIETRAIKAESCKGPPCDCRSHPGLGNLFGAIEEAKE